ncbi:hypothetical protein RB653_002392 [Dictyostelium firmibasis]|uniref:Uncharacterized protein n=1 Tax=Dictyostelium firmibasis TaxID=79012 RepID=A0AAN7TX59_9MYCE
MSLLRLNVCDSVTGICFYEKIWKWSGTSIAEGICKLVLTFHKLSNEVGDTGEVKGVLFEAPTTQSNNFYNNTLNNVNNKDSGSSGGSSSNINNNITKDSSSGSNSSSTTTSPTPSNNTSVSPLSTSGGSIVGTPTTVTSNIRHSFHSRTPSTTGSSSTAKRIKPIATAPPIRLSCEKDDKTKVTVSVFYEHADKEDQVKTFLLQILQEFGAQYSNKLPDLRPTLSEMSEFPETCKTKPDEILSNFKDFEKTLDKIKIQSKLD